MMHLLFIMQCFSWDYNVQYQERLPFVPQYCLLLLNHNKPTNPNSCYLKQTPFSTQDNVFLGYGDPCVCQ